jgi:galactokinase
MDYIANKLKMGKKTNEETEKISKLNRKSSFQRTFNKYNHYVCGFHLLCEKKNYNFLNGIQLLCTEYTPYIY